jgi:hypothetical protein
MTEATGGDLLIILLIFGSIFAFLLWGMVYVMNEWGKNNKK